MVEILDTVIALLQLPANSGFWVIGNTSDRIPFITKIWEANNPQPRNNNEFVLLYESGNNLDYPSLGMKWKDEDWLVSIEIRTTSRAQMIKIDTEILRILDANIVDVADCSYMEPRGRRDLIQDKNKPFFRMVRDVSIRKLSIVTP